MKILIDKFFNFDDSGIEQLKVKIKRLIEDLQQLSNLDLSMLEEIVIPDDFGKELIEYQKKHGLQQGYTHNEHAKAYAKVLQYKIDGEKKCTIFLEKHIVGALNLEDTQQFAINTIHHELCHVHDDYHKNKIFKNDGLLLGDNELSTRLYDNAWGVWSEYFALRTSAITLPADSDLLIPFLQDLVEDTQESIRKEVYDYRFHGDMSKFFPRFEESVYFLLKMAATVLGNIHGLTTNISDETMEKFKNEMFKESDFNKIWLELWDALQLMYSSYPNWEGLSDYDPVSNVVKETWNLFGIFPEMTSEGMYIHIP